jgi:HupE / UreJ protein
MLMMMLTPWLSLPAQAHDVRPAYLDVTENPGGDLRITWREPVAGLYALHLVPTISAGWLEPAPVMSSRTDTTMVREWQVASPHADLVGTTVRIDGLDSTITDVMLHVQYRDGSELTHLLRPSSPAYQIPSAGGAGVPVRDYLQLGFTHIWGGIDHLLYIFGLTLLVRNARSLLKTITGFTVAHSITLAAAALGFIHVPVAPVEACIALSILYVADEVLNARAGKAGIAQRAPWAIAFCFGLLHGLGFAGALAEIGLPARHIPMALLLFNIGIELGQICFVILLLLAARALRQVAPALMARFQRAPAYAIGGVASFWLIQRCVAIL